MKILFCINSIGEGGGAERVITELANYYAIKGNDVLMVNSFIDEIKDYELNDKVKRYIIDEHKYNNFLERNYIRIKKLRNIIKNEKPEVVVSFMAESNIRNIIATAGTCSKCIISIRNDPFIEYPGFLGKILRKFVLPKADGCVFQTEDAKLCFNKKFGSKSSIIMNQVNEKFFEKDHLSDDYFVATGRLVDQKNYPLMIKGFARFAKEYPNEKLYIYGYGEDEEKNKLIKLIKSLDAQNNIFYKGPSGNIAEVLAHAKVFVLTSDFEGMPNGLLEAIAMGLPVVSTDCPCGGPKYIIKGNGILIKTNDETGLYNALKKMQEDLNFRKNCAINSKKISKQFKPDVVYENWSNYINQVINKKNK